VRRIERKGVGERGRQHSCAHTHAQVSELKVELDEKDYEFTTSQDEIRELRQQIEDVQTLLSKEKVGARVYMYVCIHVYMQSYMLYTLIQTYLHTYMHAYIHIHIYIHTNIYGFVRCDDSLKTFELC